MNHYNYPASVESKWNGINDEFAIELKDEEIAHYELGSMSPSDCGLSLSLDFYFANRESPHPHSHHGSPIHDRKIDASQIKQNMTFFRQHQMQNSDLFDDIITNKLPPNSSVAGYSSYHAASDISYKSPVSISEFKQRDDKMIETAQIPQNRRNVHNEKVTKIGIDIKYYQSMGVHQLLRMKLSLQQLIEYHLIYKFILHQNGSRYIQRLLNNDQNNSISLLIAHLVILNNKCNLSFIFAYLCSYVISLLFQLCNESEVKLLLNIFVYRSIINLLESLQGSQFIEKMMNILLKKRKYLLIRFVSQFENEINQRFGNFSVYLSDNVTSLSSKIIQQIISLKLPYEAIKFIGDALQQNLAYFCGSHQGSRITQQFITFYGNKNKLNFLQLFDDKESYFNLSKLEHGNYTIQHVIQKHRNYSNLAVFNKFRNKFIYGIFSDAKKLVALSINRHGSAVMETCIESSNSAQIKQFVDTVCLNKGAVLKQILFQGYGNYVARSLLRNCVDYISQREMIVNTVHQHIVDLYDYQYGNVCTKGTKLALCEKFIDDFVQCKTKMDDKYFYN